MYEEKNVYSNRFFIPGGISGSGVGLVPFVTSSGTSKFGTPANGALWDIISYSTF